MESLSLRQDFRAEIQAHVDHVNSGLPKFQQIKRWDLLRQEMTIVSGELTPTLKV